MQHDFRQTLRSETRDHHHSLDRLVSAIDIAVLDGFQLFAQLHWVCFKAMQARLPAQARSRATLDAMIEGLGRDLRLTAAVPDTSDLPLLPQLDPLAIDYMVAGSRLGTKVLRKTWEQSTDPVVMQASGYFGQDYDESLWPDTCRSLSEISIQSPRARVIVNDTRHIFELFVEGHTRLTTGQEALT